MPCPNDEVELTIRATIAEYDNPDPIGTLCLPATFAGSLDVQISNTTAVEEPSPETLGGGDSRATYKVLTAFLCVYGLWRILFRPRGFRLSDVYM